MAHGCHWTIWWFLIDITACLCWFFNNWCYDNCWFWLDQLRAVTPSIADTGFRASSVSPAVCWSRAIGGTILIGFNNSTFRGYLTSGNCSRLCWFGYLGHWWTETISFTHILRRAISGSFARCSRRAICCGENWDWCFNNSTFLGYLTSGNGSKNWSWDHWWTERCSLTLHWWASSRSLATCTRLTSTRSICVVRLIDSTFGGYLVPLDWSKLLNDNNLLGLGGTTATWSLTRLGKCTNASSGSFAVWILHTSTRSKGVVSLIDRTTVPRGGASSKSSPL